MEENNMTPKPSGNGGKTAGIVIAIIILVVFVLYFAKGKMGNNIKSENNTVSQNTTQNLSSQPTTLNEILALGKTQMCDVTFAFGNSEARATMYMSGNRMRGDYFAKVNDTEVNSHMINDGKYIYSWVDGTQMGVKMSTEVTENYQNTDKKASPSIDPNSKYTYNCKPWITTETLLIAPSTVSFTDVSGIAKPVVPVTPVTGLTAAEKAKRCAVCDSSPEEAKIQCRQALSCQ